MPSITFKEQASQTLKTINQIFDNYRNILCLNNNIAIVNGTDYTESKLMKLPGYATNKRQYEEIIKTIEAVKARNAITSFELSLLKKSSFHGTVTAAGRTVDLQDVHSILDQFISLFQPSKSPAGGSLWNKLKSVEIGNNAEVEEKDAQQSTISGMGFLK